jgi:hypothetical protein
MKRALTLASRRKIVKEQAAKRFERLHKNENEHPWLGKNCPCFGCPFAYNQECENLKYSIPCTYIEEWVLRSYRQAVTGT